MAKSSAFPSLERKPGGPDNWVEETGGLPSYIERIAKRLHYEKGMSISRSIAVAVNTVKRWSKGGTVTENGTTKRITPQTQALAAKAVAEWTAKKAKAKIDNAAESSGVDLSFNLDNVRSAWSAQEDAKRQKAHKAAREKAARSQGTDTPTMVDYPDVPYRYVEEVWSDHIIVKSGRPDAVQYLKIPFTANDSDGYTFGAEQAVKRTYVDLANPFSQGERKAFATKDVAMADGSFPIRNVDDLKKAIQAFGRAKDKDAAKQHIAKRARALRAANLIPSSWDLTDEYLGAVLDLALTKDGRKSFKGRGKWKHGFIPVDTEAKTAKAKGSPIAMKRMNRLFGGGATKKGNEVQQGRVRVSTRKGQGNATERTSTGRIATATRVKAVDSKGSQRLKPSNAEESKGGGIQARARKSWNDIPDSAKVTRNGKRYVLSVYKGRQQLVEWVGNQAPQLAPDTDKRRLRSLREVDAAKLTTGELRNLLRVPGQPDNVKKVLNKVLAAKRAEKKKEA